MPSSRQAPSVVDDNEPLESPSTAHYSLSRAVHARRDDYTRPHRIRVKIGTWNVAACPGTDKDLASWFIEEQGLEPYADSHLANLHLSETSVVESEHDDGHGSKDELAHVETNKDGEKASVRLLGGDKIGLYVLGLQEVVSLNLVQQSLYTDSTTIAKWRDALESRLPKGYQLVACQQMVGLLLLIYASPEVAATISNESTVSVGTGLWGYGGNKGAVSCRLLLGETTSIVFSNCHLSSGHDQTALDRRCWDYKKILLNTRFAPISFTGVEEDEEAKIGDEDYSFLFGDLNFRLDGLPGDDIKRILTLHTRGEYDLTRPGYNALNGEEAVIVNHNSSEEDPDGTKTPGMVSRETSFTEGALADDDNAELPDPDEFVPDPHEDPASLQATLDSLLSHDQLGRVIKQRKALHQGWREGPITFLPTYKYDVGTVGHFDSSEKKRAPSWCDRVLFRTRRDLQNYENKVREEEEARKKDEDMQKRGIDTAADDEGLLFDYDPAADIYDPATDAATSGDSIPTSENMFDYDEEEASGDETAVASLGTSDCEGIKLDIYTSHHRITSSDHKPIVGIFTLDYKAVIPELKARVHAEVAKELDRAENEGRPGITIVVEGKDPHDAGKCDSETECDIVDFGDAGFLCKKTQYLTIANTGSVQAVFSFVDKPGVEDGLEKQAEWLQTSFVAETDTEEQNSTADEITLEPGETISVLLTLHIRNLALVRALNTGTTQLEEVLVLRVSGGRDHFVPVRATWRPTCFGRSLEELIRIPPGGIRNLAEATQLAGIIPPSLEVYHSSPVELYKLTEAIEALSERVVADENMLDDCQIPREIPGWPFWTAERSSSATEAHEAHLVIIIQALEEDKPILDALNAEVPSLQRIEAVCEMLVLFLRGMPDGIIPAPLWSRIESSLPDLGKHGAATDLKQSKDIILDVLATSPYNNISFVFLTSMLGKLASDLIPLNRAELEFIAHKQFSSSNSANIASRTIRGAIGVSRGLSFRRPQGSSSPAGKRSSSLTGSEDGTSTPGSAIDEAAIERRMTWEKRAAEIIGAAMCRSAGTTGNRSTSWSSASGLARASSPSSGGFEGFDEDTAVGEFVVTTPAPPPPPPPPMSPPREGKKQHHVTVQDKMAGVVETFFRRDASSGV